MREPVVAAEYGIDNSHARNAIEDVIVLEQLESKLGLRNVDLLRHVKTISSVVQKEDHLASKSINKEELKCLGPTVTTSMITKIAAACISLEKLKATFRSGGEDAVAFLLSHDVNGKPNVTKMKKKIAEIVAAVQNTIRSTDKTTDK